MKPAFPAEEHRERLDRAREAMRAAGLDACICVAPEHIYYLSGYEATTHWVWQALVVGPEGEPTLVLRDVDPWHAAETSWVRDVRTYHLGRDNPAAVIAAVAREKGVRGGRVGVELQSHALPGAFALALIDALAPARIEDATDLIGSLRLVKSPREMEYVREAARYARAGMEAAYRALRPSVTETAVTAEMHAAMLAAGSDHSAMPIWIASGPRTPGMHATASDRRIETGDLVHLEFAGAARRYHVVNVQTIAVGDPGPRAREAFRIVLESLRAGSRLARIGAPVAAIEQAAVDVLAREGLGDRALMRFGYGVSAAYSPTWIEPLNIIRESRQVLEKGMVFLMHACLQLPEENLGAIHGGTYTLTDAGLETLAGGDTELRVL